VVLHAVERQTPRVSPPGAERAALQRYAADTWRSFGAG
jgi:hypothetical protein